MSLRENHELAIGYWLTTAFFSEMRCKFHHKIGTLKHPIRQSKYERPSRKKVGERRAHTHQLPHPLPLGGSWNPTLLPAVNTNAESELKPTTYLVAFLFAGGSAGARAARAA